MRRDHYLKYCLTVFATGSILVACQSADTRDETAATSDRSEYELLSMKKDSNVYNASGDKAGVFSHPVQEDTTVEMGPSPRDQRQMTEQTTRREQSETLAMEQQVLFDFDSSQLSAQAENKLDQLAEAAKQADAESIEISLAGHADAIGPNDYNQQLSRERAQSVKEYLSDQLTVAVNWDVDAYGESRPTATNSTAEGRQENRRVHLRIVDNGELES